MRIILAVFAILACILEAKKHSKDYSKATFKVQPRYVVVVPAMRQVAKPATEYGPRVTIAPEKPTTKAPEIVTEIASEATDDKSETKVTDEVNGKSNLEQDESSSFLLSGLAIAAGVMAVVVLSVAGIHRAQQRKVMAEQATDDDLIATQWGANDYRTSGFVSSQPTPASGITLL